jgi:hypothetical protein
MEMLMTKNDFAKEVRQINTTSGYFIRFYELTGENLTHQEAWQRLEEERNELGLEDKYSTYSGFRKAKSTYMDMKFV